MKNRKHYLVLWLVPALIAMIAAGCKNKTEPPPPPYNTATVTKTATTVVNSPTVTLTSTETAMNTATATATTTSTMISTAIPTVGGAVAQATVALGTSSTFAILSDQAITDIPNSAITGDVGISPGVRTSMTGGLETPGDPQINGTGGISGGAYASYASDDLGTVNGGTVADMLTAAKADALNAFNDAMNASRGTATSISGNLNGLTLAPGLYESLTSIEISPGGILYLDGQGDPNAVFVIRSATTITTESTSAVVLSGNVQAKNIFWVAGSAITLGTNSIMKGTLIAGTSISFLNQAALSGRALIQGATAGQISLSQNIITLP